MTITIASGLARRITTRPPAPRRDPSPSRAATAVRLPLHVHLTAVTENARFVEFFPDDTVLDFRRLIDRRLEVRDGGLVLPGGTGLGFGFTEDTAEKYAIDGWS